ncbi:hypothetical protein [Deinococcus misasensis]|uniref:hypothetical protein n=1 Tax=Deinococcus misasensis TaxID=392413 RepID=UPI00054FFE33|nr:hypothetical protein [Deinococcus misasensis]
MEFSPQIVPELQTHTQKYLVQQGFAFQVSGSVSQDNSIDLTLRDPQSTPSKGVVLRLTEEFLRFSDPHRVHEVLEQQAHYFAKQGLHEMEPEGFPVIVIGAT